MCLTHVIDHTVRPTTDVSSVLLVSMDRMYDGLMISGRSFFDTLGPSWEHWSEHCVADMTMHASNELVHHAAEIGVLRDLYRDLP